MKRFIQGLSLGLLVLVTPPTAEGQTRTQQSDFDVSDGQVDKAAGDRLIVGSKKCVRR
jgi:hypothetical protein